MGAGRCVKCFVFLFSFLGSGLKVHDSRFGVHKGWGWEFRQRGTNRRRAPLPPRSLDDSPNATPRGRGADVGGAGGAFGDVTPRGRGSDVVRDGWLNAGGASSDASSGGGAGPREEGGQEDLFEGVWFTL